MDMVDGSESALRETPAIDTTPGAAGLKRRWIGLREVEPRVRARDAAGKLGVSEAELVACRCGEGVRRLDSRWGDLIQALPRLGEVMVLTRNEHVVHEKTGVFDKIRITGPMGLVLNREIDLRIMLNNWGSGYAVTEENASGTRHSLQFFAPDGTAIHKIYIPADADTAAYEALVAEFLADDQSPEQAVRPLAKKAVDRPDDEIDAAALRTDWLALRDVHDFMAMLRRHKAGRIQAMKLVGDNLAWQVPNDAFTTAVTKAAETGLSIMIFVGSPGVIQIHTGSVENLKVVGPWFNVLDEGFNLHLRAEDIAQSWVVRKPTKDGHVTSLEVYNADGDQIALMFGERREGQPENEDWRTLVESLGGETV